MDIQLNDLVPHPLKGKITENSEIWNTRLRLDPGGKYFVEAPSGRGKTTLVHILYGLRKDYSGSASWAGEELKTLSPSRWAARRARELSIVFQDLRLFPELTVEENLQIKQALSPELSMKILKSWAGQMGMAGKWTQPAGTLSFGEQQRVAILRSLIQPFRWLLMDEPFSHLDQQNIQIAQEIIAARLAELGAGMVWLDLERPGSPLALQVLRL